jgi:hypothetical protein
LIQKLDELVQKEITTYKKCSRQRCFKCRHYGHIAKDCDKVCKQCYYLHPGKICILNLIQSLQEVLAFNYKNFITYYDIIVGKINELNKNSFTNLSVISCPSLTINKSYLIPVIQTERRKILVGKISELKSLQYDIFNKQIKNQMRDYAQQHKIAVKDIELVHSELPDLASGMTFDVDCHFTKIPLIKRLGSRFSVKCDYDIFYSGEKLILDKDPWGNAYRIEEKQVLPQTKPIFTTNFKQIRSDFKKRNQINLNRFNKMLRLYTTQDELTQNKHDIEVAQQQLSKLQQNIENEAFNYTIQHEKYKEGMRGLRQKYTQLKQKLIDETRCLKQKNFSILNKVQKDCKVAAKTAIENKKMHIANSINQIKIDKAVSRYDLMNYETCKSLLARAHNNSITLCEITPKSDPYQLEIRYTDLKGRSHTEILRYKQYNNVGAQGHKECLNLLQGLCYEAKNSVLQQKQQAKTAIENNERESNHSRPCYDSESDEED